MGGGGTSISSLAPSDAVTKAFRGLVLANRRRNKISDGKKLEENKSSHLHGRLSDRGPRVDLTVAVCGGDTAMGKIQEQRVVRLTN